MLLATKLLRERFLRADLSEARRAYHPESLLSKPEHPQVVANYIRRIILICFIGKLIKFARFFAALRMTGTKDIFNRTELLLGRDVMYALSKARVIIFGVGGVGSWCAEGLVRSGIKNITLVDPDAVSTTNINRQLMATTSTVGRPKVLALKDRLTDINPEVSVNALETTYSEETSGQFDLDSFDYIIDAVDSLKNKILLILNASASKATFYCSMGAALKVDPCRVKVAEFWDVRGCPLGAMIRKKMRKAGTLPQKKFLCVYDDEVLPNLGEDGIVETDTFNKAQINGTTAPVTAIFGMTLAGLVLRNIYKKNVR